MAFRAFASPSCSCSSHPGAVANAGVRTFRLGLRGPLDAHTSLTTARLQPALTSQGAFGVLPRSWCRRPVIIQSAIRPSHACEPSLRPRAAHPAASPEGAKPQQGQGRTSRPAFSQAWYHLGGARGRPRRLTMPIAVGSPAAGMGVSDSGSTARQGSSDPSPVPGSSGDRGPASEGQPQETNGRLAAGTQTSLPPNGLPLLAASPASTAAGPLRSGSDTQPAASTSFMSASSSTSNAGATLDTGVGGTSTSASGEAATSAAATSEEGAEADTDPAPPAPPATACDGLPDTQKYVLAEEWGFTHVGADLPEGTLPSTFSDMFPPALFTYSPARVALALAVPLAAMAAGYGWLWYFHSICPLWQQLVCGVLIGTAYTGLFKVAHECARYSFLPQSPVLRDTLGALLMLPSLYSFPSWRLHHLHHLLHVNMLWQDDRAAWHPYTKLEMALDTALGNRVGLALRRLVLATPLKLLGSIGHWLRSFDGLDLKRFHPDSYTDVLLGWALPLLFMGFGIPAIIAAGGFSGFASCYLFPWLVFHFWLSTLSLLLHTAPHIPFRPEEDGYDAGRATICGTVTVRLPRPLELLLNEANYVLPQMVAPGLPFYHARTAYEYMRERLGPYMTEATLSVKLLTNHITKWQVYDQDAETYRSLDEMERVVAQELQEVQEEVDAMKAAAAEGAQQDSKMPQAEGGAAPGLAVA